MTEEHDFGACCTCGAENGSVRNFITLNLRAPIPGTGWGCAVCGIPGDGAAAVVCDECLEGELEINRAIYGYATEKQRIDIEKLTEPFEHDLNKHREEEMKLGWVD